MAEVSVRPLAPEDRAAWGALWHDYLAFYATSVDGSVYDVAFERLLSGRPGEFRGLIALADGRPVGLTHFLFHRHGWRIEPVVYLQDLYVAPEARGTGLGRALIEAVYAEADAAGSPSVYWLTQEGNATARRLYDRLARATDFIKYQR
ncbi:MAG: GNAT family N-acetyltransferase [Paracoccaceae bacterium]